MYTLLSHNDLDGVGCGILAKLVFHHQVKVRYNSIAGLNFAVESFLEKEKEDRFLLITDLSVNERNEKKLEEFYQKGGRIQLIDHHVTALHYNDYEWGHVVVNDEQGNLTSATSLLYEYLISHDFLQPKKAIDEFVELVRQYDTWEWEKNDNQKAHRLNSLFFLLSIDEFEDIFVSRLQNNDSFFFDDFEERLLDMEEDKIERYIRRKRRELVQIQVGEYLAGVVFAESYISELGNELGKEYPHLDYIAILNIGARRMGLRTIHDDVDVSKIAHQYGGGGHAKASGCSLTNEAYKQFVLDTFALEPLREDAKRNRYNLKDSIYGSLYEDRLENMYLLYPVKEDVWRMEQNGKVLEKSFQSFEEAERYVKRNFAPWLVKDDVFVSYIMECLKKQRNNE